MPRARLLTTYDLVQARLWESRLKELDLPVTFSYGRTGVSWYQPGGPFEVWIEDASRLEGPEVQEALRELQLPRRFTQEEEDQIEQMPFHDEPTEYGMLMVLVLFVLFVVILLLAVHFVLPWLGRQLVGA
jgi:hypothetical protein